MIQTSVKNWISAGTVKPAKSAPTTAAAAGGAARADKSLAALAMPLIACTASCIVCLDLKKTARRRQVLKQVQTSALVQITGLRRRGRRATAASCSSPQRQILASAASTACPAPGRQNRPPTCPQTSGQSSPPPT